jgi:hypothetical protein
LPEPCRSGHPASKLEDSGGVAAYRNYVQDEGWGNWQRDVLIGAGIGLGVGLVLGVASAASANRTFTGPIADQRPTGFSSPVPV